MAFLSKISLIASLVLARPIAAAPTSDQPSGPSHDHVHDQDLVKLVAHGFSRPQTLGIDQYDVYTTYVHNKSGTLESVLALRRSEGEKINGDSFYMNTGGNILSDSTSQGISIASGKEANALGLQPLKFATGTGSAGFQMKSHPNHIDDLVYLDYGSSGEKFHACKQIYGDKYSSTEILQLFFGPEGSANHGVCEIVGLFPFCAGDFTHDSKENRPTAHDIKCYKHVGDMKEKGFDQWAQDN